MEENKNLEHCSITLCNNCFETVFQGKLQEFIKNNFRLTKNTNCQCFYCFGLAKDQFIFHAVNLAQSQLQNFGNDVTVAIDLSPVLDVPRCLLKRLLLLLGEDARAEQISSYLERKMLSAIKMTRGTRSLVYKEDKAPGQLMTVSSWLKDEEDFGCVIIPGIVMKKAKRKIMDALKPVDEKDELRLSQYNADKILSAISNFNIEEIKGTILRLNSFFYSANTHNNEMTMSEYSVNCSLKTFYLLGRYLKFSREVPQAAWVIDGQRKGRNSVEEIICSQVSEILQAASCQMHSCGREDIDVRCLGNGRPFVLEVNGAKQAPSDENLYNVVDNISKWKGMNEFGDISVGSLKLTEAASWSTMQAVAEEKKKAYRCVIWCENAMTRTELQQQLDNLIAHRGIVGEENKLVLNVSQKTPLRVLHRRSLMARPRCIYKMETTFLSPHYFLLDLVTAAGFYIKEFVHGDLGRTVPNVGEILGCQTEILQLDVIWLFDDFEGGGEPVKDCLTEDISWLGEENSGLKWKEIKRLNAMGNSKRSV